MLVARPNLLCLASRLCFGLELHKGIIMLRYLSFNGLLNFLSSRICSFRWQRH
jgi:hypothetical protein